MDNMKKVPEADNNNKAQLFISQNGFLILGNCLFNFSFYLLLFVFIDFK